MNPSPSPVSQSQRQLPRSTAVVAAGSLLVAAFTVVTLLVRAEDPKSKKTETMEASKMTPATPDTASGQPAHLDEADLRKRLTPEQYRVTRENGTEPPFRNAYCNEHRPGIYVDVITGEPLFSSLDKFESGTGWPSFTKPLAKENVVEKTDRAFGMERTEARSKSSDSHLGHIFNDGPRDQGGMRYCMNSAALRFVPVEKLEAEGYGKYLAMFEQKK